MKNIWKDISTFPSIEELKEIASHYHKNILKIVIADDSSSLYLIVLKQLDNGIDFSISLLFISEVDNTKEFHLEENDSKCILDSLNKYILELYKDEMIEPSNISKWCLISDLWKFIEDSIVNKLNTNNIIYTHES